MNNDAILKSWKRNAKAWNATIENQSIPSRKYTNNAILEAILELGLNTVADFGCGEGWLCRELTKHKIRATGFDATEMLIDLAKQKGNSDFYQLNYQEILQGKPIQNAPFDGAVFNFSIYQEDNLSLLFDKVLKNLKNNGVLLIQTLHPFFLVENGFGYRSQWLSDSWKGLPGDFVDGHSWYARTMEDWIDLISEVPLNILKIKEVVNDEKEPISLQLILKK